MSVVAVGAVVAWRWTDCISVDWVKYDPRRFIGHAECGTLERGLFVPSHLQFNPTPRSFCSLSVRRPRTATGTFNRSISPARTHTSKKLTKLRKSEPKQSVTKLHYNFRWFSISFQFRWTTFVRGKFFRLRSSILRDRFHWILFIPKRVADTPRLNKSLFTCIRLICSSIAFLPQKLSFHLHYLPKFNKTVEEIKFNLSSKLCCVKKVFVDLISCIIRSQSLSWALLNRAISTPCKNRTR